MREEAGRRAGWVLAYRGLVATASAVALGGWITLELDAIGPGLTVMIGAEAALGVLAPSLSMLASGIPLTAVLADDGTPAVGRVGQVLRRPSGGVVPGPGRTAWLSLPVLVALMLLTTPVALWTSPGDLSIYLVVAFVGLLLAPVSLLVGYLAWLLVVLPTLLLIGSARRLRGSAGPRRELMTVGFAVMLLGIGATGTLVALGVGAGREGSPRASMIRLVLILLGLDGSAVTRPDLIWLARAAAATAALGVLLMYRATRPARGRPRRREHGGT